MKDEEQFSMENAGANHTTSEFTTMYSASVVVG
jgi:hypothetical protein